MRIKWTKLYVDDQEKALEFYTDKLGFQKKTDFSQGNYRWLAIAFTVTVIVTMIALQQKEPVVWMSYLPLLPLAFLEFTGLYMFVLPYATKWRSGRRTNI